MSSRFYQKEVVEGKSFLVLAILVALGFRIAAYFHFDSSLLHLDYSGGYLWFLASFIFEDKLISILGSTICVGLIAYLLSFINGKFIIIRRKTFFPAAFSLLLFSIHPYFLFMGAYYLGSIFALLGILYLFQSYQTENKQKVALNTSFLLAIGSLFYFNLLLYFIVFWIGLAYIRSFGFKPFCAFFIGLILAYTPVFAYSFIINDTGLFLLPFTRIQTIDFAQFPFFYFSLDLWIVLGFGLLLLSIFLVNNYINSYKDKIKIRTFLSFLSIVCIFSVLCLFLLNVDAFGNLFIYISVGALLFAHYFALGEHRAVQILFYITVIFCLSVSVIFFLLPS